MTPDFNAQPQSNPSSSPNSSRRLNRRAFLAGTGLASAAATSALAADKAQTPAAGTGPITLIDCQSHLFCPELVTLMEGRARAKKEPYVERRDGMRYLIMGDWLRKIPDTYFSVDHKLAAMDAAGVGLTALSINDPGPEWFGERGAEVAILLNDFIAGIVKKHPDRFFGLCVLPWQDVDASLKELERCVKTLGMKGLLLYTNLAGRFPDEPEFRPVLKLAASLGVPVLLHPAKPLTIDVVKGYEMTSSLGNMFDNTIALNRLIMSGVLDELPDLKLVCPHLGGTLPFIIGRIDHQTQVLKRGPKYLKRAPSEYLKQVWLDIVSPLPLAMKFAHEFMGPDRLLFSSDHPWVEPKLILDTFQSLNLPPADQARILGGNARKLFNLG